MNFVLRMIVVLLPWSIRRLLLERFWGYSLHPKSKIGLSWVFPKYLIMQAGARIDSFSVCKGLDTLKMEENSIIGNLNWITGMPLENELYFVHEHDRNPMLHVKEGAAVTNRHLIDCTNAVIIGKNATFAGFKSQILTHSIDFQRSRQTSAPVEIGEYCFVGTNCVLLKGSRLPDFSVLGASSVLNKKYYTRYRLYAGNPAEERKVLSKDLDYFHRAEGFVS